MTEAETLQLIAGEVKDALADVAAISNCDVSECKLKFHEPSDIITINIKGKPELWFFNMADFFNWLKAR